jgi:hypothetical protein
MDDAVEQAHFITVRIDVLDRVDVVEDAVEVQAREIDQQWWSHVILSRSDGGRVCNTALAAHARNRPCPIPGMGPPLDQ